VIAGRRAFVIVLDACGAGALPDAADYGDAGTNTLRHVAEREGGFDLPTLERLGLGNVTEIPGAAATAEPVVHGRLAPLGHGKDTTTGHWELMGVSAPRAPVYTDGFPPEVIEPFTRVTDRDVLCNAPREGLRAIDEFGEEHLRTGALILYTSQDSVFQLAAHVDVVSEDELYGYCGAARELLRGEHAVGRVIARPFRGSPGAFERTPGRRDYALDPPARTYLDELAERDCAVHAVGKVGQVFNGRGIAVDHPAPDNAAGIEATEQLLGELDEGLVFTNLVDTDQVFGHRKDTAGFHMALREIDAAVARWLGALRPGDMLVLTADHGCDPAHPGSDHTREFAPLLATFEGQDGRRADGLLADVGASVLLWLTGECADLPGAPFLGRTAASPRNDPG
jgi:phosphopentomutase